MNNIGIVIGAVIISLTIFFTFGNEDKIVTNTVQVQSEEDRLLQSKIEELQNKLLALSEKGEDVESLKKQIEGLQSKLSSKGNKNKIIGTAAVYNYINDPNVEPVAENTSFTANGTPYMVYKKNDPDKPEIVKDNHLFPPDGPGLSSMDLNGEKIYYTVQYKNKEIIFESKDDDEQDTLEIIPAPPAAPPPVPSSDLFDGEAPPTMGQ